MDIYDFINSKDIRQHCREIEHPFNSLEAAFLIQGSHRHTIAEKHAAWQEVIRTMPDCSLQEGILGKRKLDLEPQNVHSLLMAYMELQNRILAEFKESEGKALYRLYRMYHPLHYQIPSWNRYFYPGYEKGKNVYRSFADCWERELAAMDEEDREEIVSYKIEKIYPVTDGEESGGKEISVIFSKEGKEMDIWIKHDTLSDMECDLWHAFEYMWIDVPTPFREGDLVYTNYGWDGIVPQPFVLTSLANDRSDEWHREHVRKLLLHGDAMDMTVYGYRVNRETGIVYVECDHDYLSVEFYTGELKGYERTLQAISLFLKNDDEGLQSLMNAYLYVMTEERVKRMGEYMDWDLKKTGIIEGII